MCMHESETKPNHREVNRFDKNSGGKEEQSQQQNLIIPSLSSALISVFDQFA